MRWARCMYQNPWNKLKCKHILRLTLVPILPSPPPSLSDPNKRSKCLRRLHATHTVIYKTKFDRCQEVTTENKIIFFPRMWSYLSTWISICNGCQNEQVPNSNPTRNTTVRVIHFFLLSNGCETPFKDAI